MPTKKQIGDYFEQEIAELYRTMGYEVKCHVPICGQEVDIIATRYIPGGGPYRVIVECKYRSGIGLAGNAEVQSIAGAFSIAKSSNAASACTIVSNNGFSLAAQEAANSAGIHLTTKRELVRGLIDFDYYLRNLKAQYVQDFGEGVDSWYIDVRARSRNEEAKPLNEFLDTWIAQRNKRPLALLGGYGTGKTSFCRHYAVRLIDKPESPIPIILPLREFQKTVRIESLIRDFLEEQCNDLFPRFDAFWRMYLEGMLLLLFDGFDEMAARADLSVIEMNLLEIEKFARKVGNVLITCRPELFITEKEEFLSLRPVIDPLSERMAIYEPIEIDLWTPEQVSQYVRKRLTSMKPALPNPPSYYLDRIEHLPELSDMSARAVHLDLIVKLLPTIIKEGMPITRPGLYQTYIQREFRRETILNKRLRIIPDDMRLALMRAVAVRGFLDSYDELDFDSAKRVISEHLDIPSSEIEYVTRDFLNRSFLRRKGDIYRFAHRSIGEYLLALELYERIKHNNFGFLKSMKNISTAVAGMVLDLFGGPDKFDMVLSVLTLNRDEFAVTEANWSAVIFLCNMLLDSANTITYSLFDEMEKREKRKESKAEASLLFHTFHRFRVYLHTLVALDYRLSHENTLSSEQMLRMLEKASDSWQQALTIFDKFQEYRHNGYILDMEFHKSIGLRPLD